MSPWFRLVKLYLYLTGGLFLLLCVVGTFPKSLGNSHDFVAADTLDLRRSDRRRPHPAVRRLPTAQA